MHKTANVLDKLPKNKQAAAKARLHQIWMAETRKDATAAFDAFLEDYRAKYPKAAECLEKDRQELLAFYAVPCRALGPPANHEPHRIDVRHRAAAAPANQRQRQPHRLPHDGL